jgi:hypothetical protein
MQTDVVTLCHSALARGNELSILGAFNIIYAPSLPHKYPPFTTAVRLRLDDSERVGQHRLRLTVMDIDGRTLGEAFVDFQMPEPPVAAPGQPELFRPIATLCITFPITGMELKSYGEHAIDLALDGEPLLRTPFYVYPPQNA